MTYNNFLLVKIWWSLIAPKWTDRFDATYLSQISEYIISLPHSCKIIVHGTWNVGHWSVKKYGLDEFWFYPIRSELTSYYKKVDTFFPWFMRIDGERVFHWYVDNAIIKNAWNIIVWWTQWLDLGVISSEEIFVQLKKQFLIKESYMLTDVDGVIDFASNTIFSQLKKWWSTVMFNEKSEDVSGWMKKKIDMIFSCSDRWEWKCWIINWKRVSNFNQILIDNKWLWTCVYF